MFPGVVFQLVGSFVCLREFTFIVTPTGNFLKSAFQVSIPTILAAVRCRSFLFFLVNLQKPLSLKQSQPNLGTLTLKSSPKISQDFSSPPHNFFFFGFNMLCFPDSLCMIQIFGTVKSTNTSKQASEPERFNFHKSSQEYLASFFIQCGQELLALVVQIRGFLT